MNRRELYQETVDIILDAYNQKKLIHGNPCRCFIGNIISSRANCDFYSDNINPYWIQALTFHRSKLLAHDAHIFIEEHVKEGMKQIEKSGYTIEEVDRLEHVFEEEYEKEAFDSQYLGMVAALNELAKIHEADPIESVKRLDKIQEEVYV